MTAPLFEAVSWILLAVLCWLFYGPYRRYRLDLARYRLFVIRGALFDSAMVGSHIGFDCRAYGMVRTTLNGMLRNLEDFNPIYLFVLYRRASRDKAWRDDCARHAIDMKRALEELPPEGRLQIQKTLDDAERELLGYVMWTSLLILVLIGAIAFHQRTRKWIDGGVRRRIRQIARYESNVAGHGAYGQV